MCQYAHVQGVNVQRFYTHLKTNCYQNKRKFEIHKYAVYLNLLKLDSMKHFSGKYKQIHRAKSAKSNANNIQRSSLMQDNQGFLPRLVPP